MNYYPINLDISGRLCVVIGGGAVASRKVASLLFCEARVRVVSPFVSDFIRVQEEEGKLEWFRHDFADTDLDGAFLVFAATDEKGVQNRVAERARELGILVNCADMSESCDFQVPAKLRRGALLIAISTGGGSPALSARIKATLMDEFGPEYGLLITLMARIRNTVVGSRSPEENGILFRQILDLPLLSCIRQKNWGGLTDYLRPVLPETVNVEMLVADFIENGCEEMPGEEQDHVTAME